MEEMNREEGLTLEQELEFDEAFSEEDDAGEMREDEDWQADVFEEETHDDWRQEYPDDIGMPDVQQKMDARVQNLLGQGYDDGFANYIASLEIENAQFKAGEEPGWQEEQYFDDGWDRFYGQYPEVEEYGVPAEVLHGVNCGASPLEVYQQHMIAEMERQVAEMERAERNGQISTGGTDADAATHQDAFLREFLKD